jgi:hypothetical protein
VLASAASGASAQSHRLLPLGDPAYTLVERLQRRGHLLGLNPTALPYDEASVAGALARLVPADLSPTEARWADRLRRRLRPTPDRAESAFTLETGGGLRATNNERLDPARWTEAADPTFTAGPANLYPDAVVQASVDAGPLVAQIGARFDPFYQDDPDGLDVANRRVFLRTEGAYVGAVGRYGEVRLGVFARQWGVQSGDGVFVSDNPQPYDALSLRIGGERASVRSFTAELDAATPDGRFTGRAGDRSREGSIRRYLAAHRVDWRPKPWLVVAGIETMVYSSSNASLSLPALLPTAVLSFLNDGPPKNTENNGVVGGLFWVQRGPVTVTGQLAFDDFDLFNGAEPASVALTGQAVVAGIADAVDVGVGLTAVTARTYNTQLPEQTYVFALRGIGAPSNDYVDARLFAEVSLEGALPGLTVSPEVRLLIQGEASFVEPGLSNNAPLILVGDAERTVRLGVRADLTQPWWFVRADVGVNLTHNDAFVRGRDRTRFVGLVEAGARVRLAAPLSLGF